MNQIKMILLIQLDIHILNQLQMINEWYYIERTLTKGDYFKLGQNVLKTNNILILKFDKYGVLKEKTFLDKNSNEKIIFSEEITENELSKKSFVQKFLRSIKTKMYNK